MSSPVKWNADIQFPTDSNFVNRITGVEFGPSKSTGNPMITLTMEVQSPDVVDIAGKQVNIAGVSTTNYYTTGTVDDLEKTEQSRNRLTNQEQGNEGLFVKLGLPIDNIPWDNLGPYLEPVRGKLVLTMMAPEATEQRKNPTAAQIEAGKKQGLKVNQIQGDIMKNPLTGQPIIKYWPKVKEIFGLAPNQDGQQRPY